MMCMVGILRFLLPFCSCGAELLLGEYLQSGNVKKRERKKKKDNYFKGNYLNELEKPGMTKAPVSGEFVLSTLMNFKTVLPSGF